MSDLVGDGFGSKHEWKDLGTYQHPDPKERHTSFRCNKCAVFFRHFYHVTPIIYEAIKDHGIPEVCIDG